MKLVIAEYLSTLKERDQLDRVLPDLLTEMGYELIAKPQTGNRQFGVDIAARGRSADDQSAELLLLVVKQGDVDRKTWDTGEQSVRASINEILDFYLKSHVEPQDRARKVRIVVASNGELKQTVLPNWSGYLQENVARANIEFWGNERLAGLIENHLLDENVFHDEDRKLLRRALALSGDRDYDGRDLHKLFLRALGLNVDGSLIDANHSLKSLSKALRVVNFAAQMFASWSSTEGDSRIGLRAMERAVVWSWHRILFADGKVRNDVIAEAFFAILSGYVATGKRYFEKVQAHCHVADGFFGYHESGCEFSLVMFEHIGMIATVGLVQRLFMTDSEEVNQFHVENAVAVAESLSALIENNGIAASPCLDRHSQDITLAMMLLLMTGKVESAKAWLTRLVRNVDYAYKAKKYVPIANDSLDDLIDEGGWQGGQTSDRLRNMSWTLAVLAGWCAILDMDSAYEAIAKNASEQYPEVCIQLWHPDENLDKYLYFKPAHFDCGTSEARIILPTKATEWRAHMAAIMKMPEQIEAAKSSVAAQAGLTALSIVAYRHFSTPVAPYFWYQFLKLTHSEIANQFDGLTEPSESC